MDSLQGFDLFVLVSLFYDSITTGKLEMILDHSRPGEHAGWAVLVSLNSAVPQKAAERDKG
jgi:hypothetical protein